MAADLFESYAVTLVASLVLGKTALGEQGMIFPILVSAVGVLVGLIGIAATRSATTSPACGASTAAYIAAGCGLLLSVVAAFGYLPNSFAGINGVGPETLKHAGDPRLVLIGAVVVGIVLAAVILGHRPLHRHRGRPDPAGGGHHSHRRGDGDPVRLRARPESVH